MVMMNVTACTGQGWEARVVGHGAQGRPPTPVLAAAPNTYHSEPCLPQARLSPLLSREGWTQVCQKRKPGQPSWSSTLLLLERVNFLRPPSKRTSGWEAHRSFKEPLTNRAPTAHPDSQGAHSRQNQPVPGWQRSHLWKI